jgi:hypothetical protein
MKGKGTILLPLLIVVLIAAGCGRQDRTEVAELQATPTAPAETGIGYGADGEVLPPVEGTNGDRDARAERGTNGDRDTRAERGTDGDRDPVTERPTDRGTTTQRDRAQVPAPERDTTTRRDTGADRQRAQRVEVLVPAGTTFDVEFLNSVASDTSVAGDQFRVEVTRDVTTDGVVAIPAGTRLLGTVEEAVPTRRIGGRARLALSIDRLELPSGESPEIDASFVAEGESETARDAATIGGAAAGGAVLGRLIDRRNKDRGTAIGAVVGGAVGTVIASRTEGEEVRIPAGAVIEVSLDSSFRTLVQR